jgi:hypothetical protein
MMRTIASTTATLAFVIGLAAGTATAKERPFSLDGTATWDNIFNAFDPTVGARFEGIAQATHLGKVTQTGTLFLSPVPNEDGLLPGYGSVILTAANGDQLFFNYTGLLNPATGLGTGALEFAGGTGRFADAAGKGTFVANLDLSQPIGTPMVVTIKGKIDY